MIHLGELTDNGITPIVCKPPSSVADLFVRLIDFQAQLGSKNTNIVWTIAHHPVDLLKWTINEITMEKLTILAFEIEGADCQRV